MRFLKPWSLGLLLCLGLPNSVAAQEPPGVAEVPDQRPEIAEVRSTVESLIQAKNIAGAVVLVQHRGEILHAQAQGHRDVGSASLMTMDTQFRIYSMTKPITSVAVLLLVEDGKIGLDDAVGDHLPEMANLRVYRSPRRTRSPGRPVTVRDLLRHTSGLTYGFFGDGPVDQLYMQDHPLYSTTLREMMAKVAPLPLVHRPGEAFTYGISTDVLGALVERVSDEPFGEFLQRRLFDPLNMTETRFYAPDASRLASVYQPGGELHEAAAESDFLKKGRLESGGGGLISTAGDYLHFCEMLLNMGTFRGQQILQQATVEAMTQNQLPPGVYSSASAGFGLGVEVELHDRGAAAHQGQYGWNGIASTHFWISPDDALVVIALTQRWPFSNELRNLLTPIVYNAITQ